MTRRTRHNLGRRRSNSTAALLRVLVALFSMPGTWSLVGSMEGATSGKQCVDNGLMLEGHIVHAWTKPPWHLAHCGTFHARRPCSACPHGPDARILQHTIQTACIALELLFGTGMLRSTAWNFSLVSARAMKHRHQAGTSVLVNPTAAADQQFVLKLGNEHGHFDHR